jgi:thioredoxin 1
MATPPQPDVWHVICLCAEWCGVCRDFHDMFERARSANPQARFSWIDIEDESDAIGDVDVETFPTLLIGRRAKAHFLGPVLPSAEHISRLLASLRSASPAPAAGPQADRLLERLMALDPGTDAAHRGDL